MIFLVGGFFVQVWQLLNSYRKPMFQVMKIVDREQWSVEAVIVPHVVSVREVQDCGVALLVAAIGQAILIEAETSAFE